MEAATLPAAPAPGAVEQAADASKKPADIFKWSEYVHVGPGAGDCELGRDGVCDDPSHFHAFIRLPNQFQHNDIRQRALAAKARRIRLLRDPESDAAVVLDSDMDEIRRFGDRDTIIDDLLNRDFLRDHTAAMRDLQDDERFEHVDQDRDRLAQLDAMAPERRDNAEREELVRHLAAYAEAVDERRKANQAPRRSALEGLDIDELVDQLREDRIAAEGTGAFMESYSLWEWYACTYKIPVKGRPSERIFASIDELQDADREVLDALGVAFQNLEAAFQRGPTGNS